MLDQLLKLDQALFLELNNLGTPTWDGFWLFITNKLHSIPLYCILLFVSYQQLGVKKTLVLLVTIGILIGVTDQLANFFKYGVQRLRPCHNMELTSVMRLVKSSCGGKYGYFSAHASNAFAVATFFTFLLKNSFKLIGICLVTWAAMVAYSRVYIGVHFPLDIFTGMCIGVFLGWLFYTLFLRVLKKMD